MLKQSVSRLSLDRESAENSAYEVVGLCMSHGLDSGVDESDWFQRRGNASRCWKMRKCQSYHMNWFLLIHIWLEEFISLCY
jgi:hypothetical protein